jgi:hypothetical protein
LGIPDANARVFLLVSAMKREKPQSVISNAGCIGYYNIISQMFFGGCIEPNLFRQFVEDECVCTDDIVGISAGLPFHEKCKMASSDGDSSYPNQSTDTAPLCGRYHHNGSYKKNRR